MTYILSATKGRSGLHSTSVQIWTPEEFFKRTVDKWRVRMEYHYTLTPDTGRSMTLLTKPRLQAEYGEYADTQIYKDIMKDSWRR